LNKGRKKQGGKKIEKEGWTEMGGECEMKRDVGHLKKEWKR